MNGEEEESNRKTIVIPEGSWCDFGQGTEICIFRNVQTGFEAHSVGTGTLCPGAKLLERESPQLESELMSRAVTALPYLSSWPGMDNLTNDYNSSSILSSLTF
jgi:hypothetical protein